jgi:subtilisin family serine protease
MLIVKARPLPQPFGPMSLSPGLTANVLHTPGLSALAAFERAGMIKRVVPLSRSRRPPAAVESYGAGSPVLESTGVRTILASASESAAAAPNAGVSIVEVDRDHDLPDLQVALASDPSIESVARVPVRYILAKKPQSPGVIAAAPPPASSLWNLAKIRWQQAAFTNARGVHVAVLDTGIDTTHPDLHIDPDNYVFTHPDFPNTSSDRDIIGHGTHVSGTVAATINNAVGINGICECDLHVWKIFDDTPDYQWWDSSFAYWVDPVMYRRALSDCLDQDVDVINLSIGGGGAPDFQEQSLFNQLLARGTVIVAAMGNERQEGSPISYPAAIPGVVAVGATSIDDTVANFSNRGSHICLSAPGVGIWSTLPTYPGQFGFEAVIGPNGDPMLGQPQSREKDYDAWAGTSMATPHVTAAVALLLAKEGQMSQADVRARLTASTDKIPAMHGADFTADYGAGRLNLQTLLQ